MFYLRVHYIIPGSLSGSVDERTEKSQTRGEKEIPNW